MEVNRIKWDEGMLRRCVERTRDYSSTEKPARKRDDAPEALRQGPKEAEPKEDTSLAQVIVRQESAVYHSSSTAATQDNVRAFGIGEMIECKWFAY